MESIYSQFVLGSSEISNESTSTDGGNYFIYTKNANYSKRVNFKRLGIHHVVLPPGARTSLPHAESLEEEFVFVISGNPHVWIDGYVYLLKPHIAVGFPSGTGIAHCLINNSDKDVELLVVGERTKKENLCSFPLNPEHKEASGIWWSDAPVRRLGPHKGLPGEVKAEEVGKEWPSCIIDCSQLKMSKGWHYPGDSEAFGEYVRLTDALRLQTLGLGYETLPPGHRSAFPHSHKLEEEFVYILSGTATVWMNGFIYEAHAGQAVAFPPGGNIAHCVINNSNSPLRYVVVGEATEAAGKDLVYYPQHQFRNEQCRKRKSLWEEDRPANLPQGPHNGRSDMGIQEHLAFRYVSEEDQDLLLNIFTRSPQYFQRVDGCIPTLQTVQNALVDGPQKRHSKYLKEFLLIESKDIPIGVIDIHIHHPDENIAYLGLLLLSEDIFGRGLGRRSYKLLEHYVKNIFDVSTVRLGVSEENDVSVFWKKLGFVENGNTYSWKGENKITQVVEFEKQIV